VSGDTRDKIIGSESSGDENIAGCICFAQTCCINARNKSKYKDYCLLECDAV